MSGYSDSPRPSRKGFIFGAVVVGLLIVIGVVVLVSSVLGGGGGAAPTATPKPTPSEPAAVDGEASVCGLDAVETTDTIQSAPVAEWVIVGTMAAPQDTTVGPGEVSGDGFRSCYARTSEGALFAAANVLAMGTDATLSAQIAERSVVPGPGQDAAQQAATAPETNGLSAQIAGFKILSYSSTDATVDLAFELNTGELVSFPQRLKWSEGDWKIVLADDGGPALRPSALQSLGGYIPWKGLG